MKKIARTLLGGIALAASFSALASCGEEAKATSTKVETTTTVAQTTTEETSVKTIPVYFYDGNTLITSIKVKEGSTLEEFTPEKEGYTFVGWYGTPNFSHEFDFSTPINKKTTLFAAFKSNDPSKDLRTWYILGNGKSPLLKENSWGSKLTDEMKLVKSENENVFTITLDLYAGDQFQFGINSSWDNQRGGGYMKEFTQDGVDYFAVVSGGLSANSRKADIKCLVDGNYTLTLSTNPLEDYYDEKDSFYSEANKEAFNYNDFDTISFTYNGEAGGVAEEEEKLESYQLAIKGTMTEWADSSRMDSNNLEVKFNYTFKEGDEFGFVWYKDENDTSFGTFLNYQTLGTTGTANTDFVAANPDGGNNNFKALKDESYQITVVISEDRVATVDFEILEVE